MDARQLPSTRHHCARCRHHLSYLPPDRGTESAEHPGSAMNLPTNEPLGGPNAPHTYEDGGGKPHSLHPDGSDIPIRRCWRHGAKSMWSAMAAKDAIYYCPECKKVWGKQVTSSSGSEFPLALCWRHKDSNKAVWAAVALPNGTYCCPRCNQIWTKDTAPNAPHERPPTGDSREPKTL